MVANLPSNMVINPKNLTVQQLLSAESEVYVIPAYQRRYAWHQKQVRELLGDIQALNGSDTHLLGSVVCLTGYHKAGINELELVDGQQRLTTIGILLHCIAERFMKEGEQQAADDLRRLLKARALGESAIPKIRLDSADTREFQDHSEANSRDDWSNQKLKDAFAAIRAWAAEQQLGALSTFAYMLRNQCTLIRMDVSEAKDAFKLFETINNRGLKLNATDIIKNFVLGNAARFGADQLEFARQKWSELLGHLESVAPEVFFRYFLCSQLKRRVTKSYVIPYFKELFRSRVEEASALIEAGLYVPDEEGESESEEEQEADDSGLLAEEVESQEIYTGERVPFRQFVVDLVSAAKVYGQLMVASTGNQEIDRRLRNLRMIKFQQTLGFLMSLRAGGCSDANFVEVLKLTEAFMLRRHICRERSNENETIFARLCSVDPSAPLPAVRAEYAKYCPTDENFKREIVRTDFNANVIDRARYMLAQMELKEQGAHQELAVLGADCVEIEHIIHQKIRTKAAKETQGDWPTYLGADADKKHRDYVGKIGNLTLFAGNLNLTASNNPYEKKKEAYRQSSISLTKNLPERMPEFRFEQVDQRSAELAEKAAEIWRLN
jgi:hypothetical protein